MNSKMSALLNRTGLRWPVSASVEDFPELEAAHGCVLLKSQWQPNKQHVKIEDFPDKTGFECFINHVHFPFAGTKESLMSLLAYGAALTRSLTGGPSLRVCFMQGWGCLALAACFLPQVCLDFSVDTLGYILYSIGEWPVRISPPSWMRALRISDRSRLKSQKHGGWPILAGLVSARVGLGFSLPAAFFC